MAVLGQPQLGGPGGLVPGGIPFQSPQQVQQQPGALPGTGGFVQQQHDRPQRPVDPRSVHGDGIGAGNDAHTRLPDHPTPNPDFTRGYQLVARAP